MGTLIVYVLGMPYSGSTLFAAALGTSSNVVNLGEVNFLENDWYDEKICSCGAPVSECAFWGEVSRLTRKVELYPDALNLERSATFDGVDGRHVPVWRRVGYILGLPLTALFSADRLGAYGRKHTRFFKLIRDHYQPDVIVDCSKTGRRLEVLHAHSDTQLKAVYLTRNLSMLFASRLKRAKRRNRFYLPAFSFLYVFWLIVHLSALKRSLARLGDTAYLQISYEDFCHDPEGVTHVLSDWLGVPITLDLSAPRTLNLTSNHIYTGNTWLTKGGNDVIQLREPQERTGLEGIESVAAQVANVVCKLLRLTPDKENIGSTPPR